MGALNSEARRTLEERRRTILGLVQVGRSEDVAQGQTREDRSDQIDADELSEVVERLSARERQELDEIDAALARIALGTYGLCEACGQAIGRQRLRAMPEARRCISCSAHAAVA